MTFYEYLERYSEYRMLKDFITLVEYAGRFDSYFRGMQTIKQFAMVGTAGTLENLFDKAWGEYADITKINDCWGLE